MCPLYAKTRLVAALKFSITSGSQILIIVIRKKESFGMAFTNFIELFLKLSTRKNHTFVRFEIVK